MTVAVNVSYVQPLRGRGDRGRRLRTPRIIVGLNKCNGSAVDHLRPNPHDTDAWPQGISAVESRPNPRGVDARPQGITAVDLCHNTHGTDAWSLGICPGSSRRLGTWLTAGACRPWQARYSCLQSRKDCTSEMSDPILGRRCIDTAPPRVTSTRG